MGSLEYRRMEVRVLDFSKFHDGSDIERQKFAKDLFDSFTSEGFVKIINHGVTKEEFDQLFDWNRQFFALPLAEKLKVANSPTPDPQRGWTCVNGERTGTLNQGGKTNTTKTEHGDLEDAKEHLDIGPLEDVQFPNRWPHENILPGFRSGIEAYFTKARKISLELVEALEIATKSQKGYFTDRFSVDASELRLNHYPSIAVSKLEGGSTRRIWPHTDFGVITLLIQDNNGGLEIHDQTQPGTAFVPVARTSETEFIVNIGDTLARWTNGLLKASLHQVTSPPHAKDQPDIVLPSRRSNAFFLKASKDESVGPMEKFVSEDRPAMHDDITALEFHKQRNSVVY